MSMDVDGTTQGETHEQETKHRVWAEVDLEKHCKIDVDGTPHGETREQEVKCCDWASVEKRCKINNVPVYQASVKYNKFYLNISRIESLKL
jgi:hypothetical protein